MTILPRCITMPDWLTSIWRWSSTKYTSVAQTSSGANWLLPKALPYLEKFRKMEPGAQEKWALPLYTIYLNLNKGKEFDEIDRLMKSKG